MPIESQSPGGTLLKKETVTTQQPDGTVVTKTTETRTVDSSYDDTYYYGPGEYEFEESEFNCIYCCTPLATLRLAQIVISFIIIGCVTGATGPGAFVGALSGQIYVLFVCCLCIIITFIILIAYLFGFHMTILKTCPWRISDLIYSSIAAILFFIAGCLEAWYASGNWGGSADYGSSAWSHCRMSLIDPSVWHCPVNIPWIIAAILCFINAILYAVGACLAAMGRHYL